MSSEIHLIVSPKHSCSGIRKILSYKYFIFLVKMKFAIFVYIQSTKLFYPIKGKFLWLELDYKHCCLTCLHQNEPHFPYFFTRFYIDYTKTRWVFSEKIDFPNEQCVKYLGILNQYTYSKDVVDFIFLAAYQSLLDYLYALTKTSFIKETPTRL